MRSVIIALSFVLVACGSKGGADEPGGSGAQCTQGEYFLPGCSDEPGIVAGCYVRCATGAAACDRGTACVTAHVMPECALADRFGFRFPIAIDHDWKTLNAWWLDDHEGWTSVSFLIDRAGVVRFVHTGGQYEPGSDDAAQMRRWIDQLLAGPAT